MVAATREAVDRVASRARELAATYEPPDFAEVPHVDAALFLCAIDHRTGYRRGYLVRGTGPYEGSALLWALGLAAERRHPGTLQAASLVEIDPGRLAALFRVGGETVADPDVRARLWRDLAAGLEQRYAGDADALIAAAEGRLAGSGGLLERLAEFEAYADPVAKKSFLFAKIAERRGWLVVSDPKSWEVCADNVLMRLVLRAGLVHPGPLEAVRAATRAALKEVAEAAGVSPPVLDDLLWELGRRDADLLAAPPASSASPRATRACTGTSDAQKIWCAGFSAKAKNHTVSAIRATTSDATRIGSSGPRA